MYNMKTKEQLIDEHCDLFSDGADVEASYRAGEYAGMEHVYHAYMETMLDKLAALDVLIDNFDTPETHE